MIQKCLLTGAMCAIMPGSPVQLLVALLVILAYLLLVLKAAPYKGDLEDRLAFLSSLCLCVSLILGFAIITDNPDKQVFDTTSMGAALVVINVTPFLFLLFAVFSVVKNGPNVGVVNGGDDNGGSQQLTQVHPAGAPKNAPNTRGFSKKIFNKAIDHHKTTVLIEDAASHIHKHRLKIDKRLKKSSSRLMERLKQRKLLKLLGSQAEGQTGQTGQTGQQDGKQDGNDVSQHEPLPSKVVVHVVKEEKEEEEPLAPPKSTRK